MQVRLIMEVQVSHTRQVQVTHIMQDTTRLWTELSRKWTGSAFLSRCSSFTTMQYLMFKYSLNPIKL